VYFLSREQNKGKSHKINTGNDSLERVGDFKYLGTNLTKLNLIREEIEGRLKSRNARYHSVQNKKKHGIHNCNSACYFVYI
jgi:hypothetical protein